MKEPKSKKQNSQLDYSKSDEKDYDEQSEGIKGGSDTTDFEDVGSNDDVPP